MKKNKTPDAADARSKLNDKKTDKSPDTSKMQMIEIDARTRIYISASASVTEAKSRYLNYLRTKKVRY